MGGEQKSVPWTLGSVVVKSVSEVFGKPGLKADFPFYGKITFEFAFCKSTGKWSMATDSYSCGHLQSTFIFHLWQFPVCYPQLHLASYAASESS